MKKAIGAMIVPALLMITCASLQAADEQGPVEKFAAGQIDQFETGCAVELNTYCEKVTPGRGRRLACIYAYNDKLSLKCEKALYDSSVELRNAADNLDAFVTACQEDIVKHCSDVVVGEGRILKCLEQNKEKISENCGKALQTASGDLGEAKEKNIIIRGHGAF